MYLSCIACTNKKSSNVVSKDPLLVKNCAPAVWMCLWKYLCVDVLSAFFGEIYLALQKCV